MKFVSLGKPLQKVESLPEESDIVAGGRCNLFCPAGNACYVCVCTQYGFRKMYFQDSFCLTSILVIFGVSHDFSRLIFGVKFSNINNNE